MSFDWLDEVGPWLPDGKQHLPLKLFDGYKVSDIGSWTQKSSSAYFPGNELVPHRIVKGMVDGIETEGREQIGPGLIVSPSDRTYDQDSYARYWQNVKECYVDGDPKPEQKQQKDAGGLYIDGKRIGTVAGLSLKPQPVDISIPIPPEQMPEFMKIMDPAFTPEEGIEEMTKKAEMPKKRKITVFVHDVDDPDEFDDFGNLALDSVLIRITPGNELSEAGRRILTDVIPEVVELFLNKSNDYKNAHESLGPKAQYVDLHRKMGKLKSALWDGQELQYEQVDEILMDLAGHVFLALDGINKENNK